MKIFYSIVAFSLLLTFSKAETKSMPLKVLCLGDSLTAGFGLTEEQAYPAILEKQLKNKGYEVKVQNAGVSGDTTAGGVRRVNWYLNSHVDVLVLALGANDGLRGLPVKNTEQNLQQIIDFVRQKNPRVKIILAGMKVPPNMGRDYSAAFEQLFPRLAKKNNLPLIPFLLDGVAGIKEFNLADGVHPNAKGQNMIATSVLKGLLPLLNELKK